MPSATATARRVLRSRVIAEPARHGFSAGLRAASRAGADGFAQRHTYDRLPQFLASFGVERVRRRGLDLELDLADNLQRTLFLLGTYEPDFLAFLERELRAGDVYLDIGGHIGLVAMVAAQRLRAAGGGRVITFEPTPDSGDKIRRGARANGLDDLIEVAPVALGAEPGRLEIRADSERRAGDAGMRSRYGAGPVICVAAQWTLDAWLRDAGVERVDVVKIDVEGAELPVLQGMTETLTELRPRAVVVEVAPVRLAQVATTPGDLDEVLAAAGYARSGEVFLENVVYRPMSDRAPEGQASAPAGAAGPRGTP